MNAQGPLVIITALNVSIWYARSSHPVWCSALLANAVPGKSCWFQNAWRLHLATTYFITFITSAGAWFAIAKRCNFVVQWKRKCRCGMDFWDWFHCVIMNDLCYILTSHPQYSPGQCRTAISIVMKATHATATVVWMMSYRPVKKMNDSTTVLCYSFLVQFMVWIWLCPHYCCGQWKFATT